MLTTSVTSPNEANRRFAATQLGIDESRVHICGLLTKRGTLFTCFLLGPFFCYCPCVASEQDETGRTSRGSASRHAKMLSICDKVGLNLILSHARCEIIFERRTRTNNIHRKIFCAASQDELLAWKGSLVRASFLWSVAPVVHRLSAQALLGPLSAGEETLVGIMEALIRNMVSLTLVQLCGDLSSMGKPLMGGWVKGFVWNDARTLRCGDRRYLIGARDVVSRSSFNSAAIVHLAFLERYLTEQVNTIVEKVASPYANRTNRHLEELLSVGGVTVKDEEEPNGLHGKASTNAVWTSWVTDTIACSRQFAEASLRNGPDLVSQFWPCAQDQMPMRVAVRGWLSAFPMAPFSRLLSVARENLLPRLTTSQRGGKLAVSGLRGVLNMGNSCYLNATLQCLTHTPVFSRFFLLNAHYLYVTSSVTRDNRLAAATAAFVTDQWHYVLEQDVTSASMVLKADDIFAALNADCKAAGIPVFAAQTQQDAHEVLVQLLDRLGEELGGRADKPRSASASHSPVPSRARPGRAASAAAVTPAEEESAELPSYTSAALTDGALIDRWRRDYESKNPHFLAKCFSGQTVQTLSCPECHALSYCCDSFMYLFASFPDRDNTTSTAAENDSASTKPVPIEECLKTLFMDEDVDMGGSKCGACRKTLSQAARRTVRLHRLPPCLILCVNRTLTDEVGYVTGKRQTPLHVRRTLALGEWLTPTTETSCPVITSSGNVESLAAFDKDPRARGEYAVYAVVLHHGGQLNKGHYTAACCVAEAWYHFDDTRVTAITDFDHWIAERAREIYILFYRSLAPDF